MELKKLAGIAESLVKEAVNKPIIASKLKKNVSAEDIQHNPLYGKKISFVGSSITEGYGSNGISFADLMKINDGIIMDKHSISGTTIAGPSALSYVMRMKRFIPKNKEFDAFVIQLSTNDYSSFIENKSELKPIGSISKSYNIDNFNYNTIIGSLEYMISYIMSNWGCPILIYTCLNQDDEEYDRLVQILYELNKKWSFTILDLYNDAELNSIMYDSNDNYMFDRIHPNLKGYNIITPLFRKSLTKLISK